MVERKIFQTMWRCFGLCTLLWVGSQPAHAEQDLTTNIAAEIPMADRVVVYKSQRKLYLYNGPELLREYSIHLGLRPDGAKEYEGDYRTPEGHYQLVRRNANSDYFLSVQVNYPNDRDLANAKRLGVSPGGAIMVHGLPNKPRKSADYYQRMDWTDGCIALNNSDMVEFWLMTRSGTPIDIFP